MNVLDTYNIAWKGLGFGFHRFQYRIDGAFFKAFDGGIVDDGAIDVMAELELASGVMALRLVMTGTVRLACNRCLELYDQPVESTNRLIIKFGDGLEDDLDVVWISPDDDYIKIAKPIYDFIVLAVPMRQVHPDPADCNPEMIKKLELLSVRESPAQENNSAWEVLEKIREQINF
ncbi:MAG: DUF177 domain-containing protein [Bacteroidales bacterium]|nr:DUF177 domain-containing protein [Bacteroidales bacterium]